MNWAPYENTLICGYGVDLCGKRTKACSTCALDPRQCVRGALRRRQVVDGKTTYSLDQKGIETEKKQREMDNGFGGSKKTSCISGKAHVLLSLPLFLSHSWETSPISFNGFGTMCGPVGFLFDRHQFPRCFVSVSLPVQPVMRKDALSPSSGWMFKQQTRFPMHGWASQRNGSAPREAL